ncbi:MAG: [LysW]-lysine hydrolase [Chloroflexi bacterium]|nr:[LysW]-lysine hydrolase [Chloroflexota bacterium]MDL1884106.1 [LysW]-lysine hydrolase [Anaerolineae bacterium CFX8]
MPTDLLTELVRRYSPSTQENEAVDYLVAWMRDGGFHAYCDAAGNACGIRGPLDAPNTLILLGHIDTVPGLIPVRIENGCLYGRGSVDAKGSLSAFAEAAARACLPDGWRVVVIGAVEEEIATSRGAVFVRDHFSPTACIIGEPSGTERITLGYKGRLLVDYRLTRPVAHTAQPTPSVGELGFTFWQKITGWVNNRNAGIAGFFDRVTPHLRSINTETDHFADTLNLTISFRLPPGLSPEETFAALKTFAEPDAELHPYGMEHAYRGDRANGLVRGMLAAIRAEGSQPGFVLKTGTSDMNVVARRWNCPIIAYGPGDSSLDHTPDEHIPLVEYRHSIEVLRRFLENLSVLSDYANPL